MWIDNRMKNLMMDVEKRTIYSWPNHWNFWGTRADFYWDESYGRCRIGGARSRA